jgi:ribosomal protein L19
MSGAVGVERIFPVNLPALQKFEINKKVQFVELEFYFRELTGKKAKSKTREIVNYLFIIKVPTVSGLFFTFF